MGCGGCQKTVDDLRQRIVDLETVLAELREEYLRLAQLFDDRLGVNDEEDGEASLEEGEID